MDYSLTSTMAIRIHTCLSVLLGTATLQRQPVALPLQHGGGDKALDLGSLVTLLLVLLALLQ